MLSVMRIARVSARGSTMTTAAVAAATASCGTSCSRLSASTSVSSMRHPSAHSLQNACANVQVSARCFSVSPVRLAGKIVPFKLADIGEGIRQVEVLQLFVKVGDQIEELDRICEVQSDKATVEITSRFSGTVRAVHIAVGATANVGAPLLDIELEEEAGSPGHAEEAPAAAAAASAAAAAKPTAHVVTGSDNANLHREKPLATPATRFVAMENNVDLSLVTPTGKGGRVTKEDVLAYLEGRQRGASSSTSAAAAAPVPPPAAAPRREESAAAPQSVRAPVEGDRVVRITGVRRAMVASMTQANQIPSFGASDEINIGKLMELRNIMRPMLAERDPKMKLTFMPFFIKAASMALLRYPELNAYTSADCSELTVKASHNIGFAMDTPNGLIVPVLRDAQAKSVAEITADMMALVDKGKRNAFAPDDLRGGTFTLSNIGSIGATYTKPVIFPPQVVIGALGRSQVLPRFDDKMNVVAANIITVSWSADHRVVDGATMVRFSNLFRNYLEEPGLMLLDAK